MPFALKDTTIPDLHQHEFLEFYKKTKGVLGLFDEPGLGKSLEILMAICYSCMPWEKALVVAPAYLVPTWKHEIEKFTHLVLGVEIDVITYHQMTTRTASLEEYVFVAFDEAHALKNMESQRGFAAHCLVDETKPPSMIYATGTPITNRIVDIYSFLSMIAYYPHVTPKISTLYPTYYGFAMNFCNVTEKRIHGRAVMQFKGVRNKEELQSYLKPWSIRRKTDDVLKDVPEMIFRHVVASYKKDSDLEELWQKHQDSDQVTKGIEAKVSSAKAKVGFTVNYVADLIESGQGPIVVGSDHREPATEIYEKLKAKGYRVDLVIGGGGVDKRAAAVQKLQNGELDAYVATMKASYEGVTLTKAKYVVVNDVPWEPSILEQFFRRVRRKTQTATSFGIFITGSIIDELITEDIRSKMNSIKKTLGD